MNSIFPNRKYIFLDGLRGIAALSVVIFHFTDHGGHRRIFSSATLAVDLFFCLSGFVIAYSYHKKLIEGMSIVFFLKKRLVRLYPMYVIGLIFGVSAIILQKAHDLVDPSWETIASASLFNLFYLPYFISLPVQILRFKVSGPIFPINVPYWSLFFELVANFAYALTIGFPRKFPYWLLIGSGIGLIFATIIYGDSPGWGTANFIGGFPRVFFSFFAGVVIYLLHDKTKLIPRIGSAYVVGLLLALLAVPLFADHKLYWLVTTIVIVPLIIASGSRCAVEEGTFWHKTYTYLGRISYPIYCMHFPMLLVISTFFSGKDNYALLMTSSLLVTIFLTHIVMKYVEEPVRFWLTTRMAKT